MARQKKAFAKSTPKRKRSESRASLGGGTSDDGATDTKKKVRWQGSRTTSVAEESGKQSDSEEESSLNTSEKICLTAWCQHGRLGCAYYDPIKCYIYVLEDTQETPHFDLTAMLLDQASPAIVLTSSKADDGFMDTLRDYMETAGGVFQIRPYKEFSPAKGRSRLLSLRLLSELESPIVTSDLDASSNSGTGHLRNAYDFMKTRREDGEGDPTMKRWNASIRLSNFASAESSPLCISSVGALLEHLVREHVIDDLDEEGIGVLDIRGIESISLEQVMQINADALFSLQIFENESHASVHSDKTKEGLSLFGILNNTSTTLGRSLLRTWLLRPSLSLDVINARHDALECFTLPNNWPVCDQMHSHLKGIKNVPRILGVLKSGRAGFSDWQGLVKFTFHSAMLRDTLSELQSSNVEIVQKLIGALDIASFRDVGTMVNETIDWEESANADRVCVRPGIDEELDNRKHVYQGIDSVLSKVAQQICNTVPPDYATSLNVVYFPQLGFLVCLPMLDEWRTDEGIQVLEGWSFQFSSESHVYFKSQEMHDMDLHVGDLHPMIVDREIEIIQELLDRILVYDEAMGEACDVCAELDCLISFAEASRAYDYRRPSMVEENVIEITQGRHPLQEQVVDTFVPNDARVVGGCGTGNSFDGNENDESEDTSTTGCYNSVVLCTGANACGKSVYLKQIALIQYMAQIGCFVPAESATLGVVDKIFTRISTRESVSKVQSAFMIDLNQVSLALRNATSRSLILLDEFGKGTLSTDGAGLFCGVLKHLLDRGASCPKVLAATHFHDVFRTDLLDAASLPITFLHMQAVFTLSNGESLTNGSINDEENEIPVIRPGEKITYLYRIAEGLALDSHAAKCAEIFGIPSRIVQRAQYVSHLISTHELGQLLDEEMTEEERIDLEDAEAVCRRFLAWDLDLQLQELSKADDSDIATTSDVKTRLREVLGREVIADSH